MSRWIILLGVLTFSYLAHAQTGEWKQLFDGKDLTGWKHVGPGSMTVEDGLIQTHGGMGLLYWTGGKLGNCTIRVVFKMRDHNMLYSLTKPLARAGKPGPEWNTMEITLDGTRTIVVLNGVKVTDYTEGNPVPERKFNFEPQRGPRPNDGYFGLQNHSDNDVVFFKEVAVRMLKN